MMKKQIALVALLFLGMSCFNASAQFKKFNLGKAIQAGKDAAQAISLSDADIAAMSKEYMEWMDKHNPLTKPDSEYGKRLERLTGNIKEVDGMKVNFGVYEVVDVNAFACGDGSVEFCVKNNIDPYGMYKSLNKLLELSNGAPASSYMQRMFSSHPDTAKRVARAKELADKYKQ